MEPPAGVELDPTCELFRRGDPDYQYMTPLGRIWVPLTAGMIGVFVPLIQCLANKRPLTSGIHRYFIGGLVGASIGEWMHRVKQKGQAEKDLHYYHYMTLHPEDFAPPKRILYRDYLEPWVPVR